MELMHRSLSAQLKALPPRGSFRKPQDFGDWNYDSQEEQDSDSEENNWFVRTLPDRWRLVERFGTTSQNHKQKVTVDLGLTTSYRKEGTNYIVRGEIFDILWDSNMLSNGDYSRGGFIDLLQVEFEPMWSQEEIVTGALFPATSNTSAYYGNSSQEGITGFISRNPTIAVSMTNTRTQQTSQPMYTCKWERGPKGIVSLNWKLNLWCPSGSLEFPRVYNPHRWPGSKVPMLPPDYEKGNFNGLDYKPRVQWVVPATVVRAGRAAWRVTVTAHLSSVSSKKRFFATKKHFDGGLLSKSVVWRFSNKTSGHMEEWLSTSASCCRSAHHSRRNSLQ